MNISDLSALSPEKVQQLIHELQVHQIELEMQNEELRQTRLSLEASRDNYSELCDFAPVGYFTLDQNGVILEANLTSANLFGVERGFLIGKPLASFVNEEDGNALYLHFRQVLETQSKQTCVIRLANKDGNQVSVRLESLVLRSEDGSPKGFRTAVIDITRRREAEAELKESEERFRLLYENVPLGYQSLDENGYFLEANRAWLDILGYSREEVIGKWFGDFLAPGYQESFKINFPKFKADGEAHWAEFGMIRKDGSLITVGLDGQVGRDGRGQFRETHWILHDISEIKGSEEALHASELRYRRLFESAQDGILIIDFDTGKILDVNPYLIDMLGYSHEEFIEKYLWEVSPFKDTALNKEAFAKLEQEGYIRYEDLPLETSDGRSIAVEFVSNSYTVNGKTFIQCSIRDITDRRKVEKALRSSEDRFHLIAGTATDTIWCLDKDYRFTYVSPADEKMRGFKAEELIGKPVFTVVKPTFLEAAKELALRLQEDENRGIKPGMLKHELELVCKDGSYVWTEGYVTPIRDERGQQVGYVGITRDISERRRAEELLRDRTEALERSNQDLEQFAYVAAHDLREPLISVAAYLKLLERRCAKNLDADAHKFLSRAIETTLRMDAVIQSLLAYSRIGSDDRSLEPTDCEAVLKNALSNLHSAIKESEATETSDALPTVMADTSQMLQLFQNLLSNAIRYRGDEPLKIHVSCAQGIGEFQFSVKDNGIGIEPPYFERIFRIFQRIQSGSVGSGTGIGLANCKKIVECHGGRIWVESEPGKGSTFFFTIPERVGAYS